jgi:UDP-N-acetylglucosamine 1-carboxyvinyltransferase
MAAAILTNEPVTLSRVPRVGDVVTLSRLLGGLGVEVVRTASGDVVLQCADESSFAASTRLVREMRASFCVLGPLLAKRGRAVVPLPGGCRIGPRPVDVHLRGLAALGAEVRIRDGAVVARAKRLKGANINLTGPFGSTVTGTANVMCAATLAEGVTTLTGAAMEPEVVDLGQCLISMGARISGLGTRTIRVEGVPRLHGTRHQIIPDRIEAATLLLAAAMTEGSITVTRVVTDHLQRVLAMLVEAGMHITIGD